MDTHEQHITLLLQQGEARIRLAQTIADILNRASLDPDPERWDSEIQAATQTFLEEAGFADSVAFIKAAISEVYKRGY